MVERGTASVQGWWVEFAGAVVRQLPRDMDPITADKWIRNQEVLKDVLREALLPHKPTVNVYPVAVDYEKSVEEMVKLGRYDRSNKAITSKNFPTKRSGKEEIQIKLVCFNQGIDIDEGIKGLGWMGFRPAELRELLAFGEKHPEVQREFRIIAFGFVWNDQIGRRFVPYLSGDVSERGLFLGFADVNWSEDCCFAAVRK